MYCILREDLNSDVKNKVIDLEFESNINDLSESGIYSSFLSTLVVNSIIRGNLFQFEKSKYGIEFLENLKPGKEGIEQLSLLSLSVRKGIEKIIESNLAKGKELLLYKALLTDFELHGYFLPKLGQIE